MMKTLLSLLVLAMLVTSMGCGPRLDRDFGATPALSSRERYQQIDRNWDYEGRMIMDDVDSVLLLRPATRLTIWHVR
jgi:hypothetical protein